MSRWTDQLQRDLESDASVLPYYDADTGERLGAVDLRAFSGSESWVGPSSAAVVGGTLLVRMSTGVVYVDCATATATQPWVTDTEFEIEDNSAAPETVIVWNGGSVWLLEPSGPELVGPCWSLPETSPPPACGYVRTVHSSATGPLFVHDSEALCGDGPSSLGYCFDKDWAGTGYVQLYQGDGQVLVQAADPQGNAWVASNSELRVFSMTGCSEETTLSLPHVQSVAFL